MPDLLKRAAVQASFRNRLIYGEIMFFIFFEQGRRIQHLFPLIP